MRKSWFIKSIELKKIAWY